MKSQTWWQPGSSQGLLSRRWVQVLVFPLPGLKPGEVDASLRYKAQSMLPTPDLALQTRSFIHRGRQFGVVLVDRIPAEQTQKSALTVAIALTLPSRFAPRSLLAVATPEGWEFHRYEQGVLTTSYPPIDYESPTIEKVLSQDTQSSCYWLSPDPNVSVVAPTWAEPVAPFAEWGLPWQAPKSVLWPWFAGVLMAAVGVVAWAMVAIQALQWREDRNHQWEQWLQTARQQGAEQTLTSRQVEMAKSLVGEPVEKYLASLGRAWPSGVQITKLEIAEGEIRLTARTQSALNAVARLSQDPLTSGLRVLQIRPVAGGEEFDLQGSTVR